jgi:hypothetical protein
MIADQEKPLPPEDTKGTQSKARGGGARKTAVLAQKFIELKTCL